MTKIEYDTLSNFIPINRTFFDHAFWKEERVYSKAEALLDLIRSARFEESEASELIDGKMVSWTRGQLPASLRYLAKRWQWSKNKVSTFLRLLENEQMIKRLTANGLTVLSLTNYDKFNGRQQRGQRKKPLYIDVAEAEDSTEDKQGTVEGHGRDKTNKENKEEDSVFAPEYSQEDKDKFKAFEEWILKNAPKVAKMKEPFTIGQHVKLRNNLPKEQVKDLLLAMQNYGPLLKKNDSAYLTILNWAKRDYNQLKAANNATTTEEYLRERKIRAEQVRKRATE